MGEKNVTVSTAISNTLESEHWTHSSGKVFKQLFLIFKKLLFISWSFWGPAYKGTKEILLWKKSTPNDPIVCLQKPCLAHSRWVLNERDEAKKGMVPCWGGSCGMMERGRTGTAQRSFYKWDFWQRASEFSVIWVLLGQVGCAQPVCPCRAYFEYLPVTFSCRIILETLNC